MAGWKKPLRAPALAFFHLHIKSGQLICYKTGQIFLLTTAAYTQR
jgi:hypothetical protein